MPDHLCVVRDAQGLRWLRSHVLPSFLNASSESLLTILRLRSSTYVLPVLRTTNFLFVRRRTTWFSIVEMLLLKFNVGKMHKKTTTRTGLANKRLFYRWKCIKFRNAKKMQKNTQTISLLSLLLLFPIYVCVCENEGALTVKCPRKNIIWLRRT